MHRRALVLLPWLISLPSLWKLATLTTFNHATWQHTCENLRHVRGLARIYDVRMPQFVLNIEKLSHIMGPRGSQDYGFRLRLWLVVCVKAEPTDLCSEGDSSFSFMPYYPSDLKSLSPANAVKICAMNVQTRNHLCSVAPTTPPPLQSNVKRYVTVTCGMAQSFHSVFSLCVFAMCLANTAVVSCRKSSQR